MKTQLLNKQIALISITIGMFFFFSAHAQIIYTDVNPDQTYSSGSYNLDLNNDGTNDFTITRTSSVVTHPCPCGNGVAITGSAIVKITPVGITEIGLFAGSSKLDQGTLIDSNSLTWSGANQLAQITYSSRGCIMNICTISTTKTGDWIDGATDKYLALRINVNSQTYYGWVRLDVANLAASFTIKDYAYNSITDSSILAGDTSGIATGIFSPINENHFSVFPNPSSDKITLSFSSYEKKEIQITNTLGQIVFVEEINSVKEEIDVSEFPAGIYVVSEQTFKEKIEKKFLKQ